jgi:hypothetical protein
VKKCASGHVYDRAGWQCPECGDEPATLDGYLSFAPALARKNEGFPAESFPQLAKLEEGHFWFEARNRLLLWVLERHFPNSEELPGSRMRDGIRACGYLQALSPGASFGQ